MFFLFFVIDCMSCTTDESRLNWNALIEKYSKNQKDSLYLFAALFLRGNMSDKQ